MMASLEGWTRRFPLLRRPHDTISITTRACGAGIGQIMQLFINADTIEAEASCTSALLEHCPMDA